MFDDEGIIFPGKYTHIHSCMMLCFSSGKFACLRCPWSRPNTLPSARSWSRWQLMMSQEDGVSWTTSQLMATARLSDNWAPTYCPWWNPVEEDFLSTVALRANSTTFCWMLWMWKIPQVFPHQSGGQTILALWKLQYMPKFRQNSCQIWEI